MQYCSACQTAIASVVILDLDEGAVSSSQHLCQNCAEQLGLAQPKAPPKFSAEILEDLLGGMKSTQSAPRHQADACPGCAMSVSEFRNKGRLGCPRCYDTWRNDLLPLLQRIHESQSHRGRLPGHLASAPPPSNEQDLTELRQKLEDAVRGERYEEAAQLRDDLRRLEQGGASS